MCAISFYKAVTALFLNYSALVIPSVRSFRELGEVFAILVAC